MLVTGTEPVALTYFDFRMKMRQLGLAIVKTLFVNWKSFRVGNQRNLNSVLSKVFMMDAGNSVRMTHCITYQP